MISKQIPNSKLEIGNAFLIGLLILSLGSLAVAAERRQLVLELRPAGYWPADEGAGEVLHDRSGNDNHGSLRNLEWRDGLLDFASDYC